MPHRDPLEEGREVPEVEPGGDIADALLAHRRIHRRHTAELSELCTWSTGPDDPASPLSRASHREPMAAHAKEKVVRHEIGPREHRQRGRDDQPKRVDDDPIAMPLEVALEHALDVRQYLIEAHVA